MMASDAIRAALIAVAAVTVWSSGPSGVVYAMAVLTMVVSTAFQPAQTALLPSLTSTPDQLTAANVVTSTIESVGTFVGPALGGLLLVWVGIGTVMAIDAVSFVWSLLMLSGIPRGEAPERGEEAPQFLTEVGDGFRAVGQNRRIQVIIGLYGAQTFVSGALTVLVVVMALQLRGIGQSAVGTRNAAAGIGAAVTPLVIDAVGVRGALLATGAVLPVLVVITWPLLSRADPGALQPERVQLMRGVPFLAPLDEPVLERIGTLLEPVPATAGTAVFQQGDRGDRFYLIERGDVAVERDGAVIARLGPGGYFGEIALVQDVPRTATVRPLTDCSLLALDRDEFIAAVTGHAPSREAADAVISTRLGTLRAGAASL